MAGQAVAEEEEREESRAEYGLGPGPQVVSLE